MSPITLCLIVKNESRYLKRCVASVREIVSYVVIVDTGSSDETSVIARSIADEFYQIPFENDFSKARNFALQHVKTPWVLFLDADESFEGEDAKNLLNCIQEAPSHVWGYQLTRYNFFGTGGWYTSKNLKLFRHLKEVYYEGSVSESVTSSIKEHGGVIVDAPVVLNHYGHCRSVENRNQKAHFYLKLMMSEIEKRPQDSRLMGYCGMILRTLGRFEEAVEMAQKGLKITPSSPHSHYCLAQVLRSVGKPEEALKHYQEATVLSPHNPTYCNMVGVLEMALGRYEQAESTFLEIKTLNPLLIHVDVNLGLLHQAKQNDVLAFQYFEKVAKRNKGFLHEDFQTRMECDPYREFYYETLFKYCGLGYHIAYCKEKIKNSCSVYYHGYECINQS